MQQTLLAALHQIMWSTAKNTAKNAKMLTAPKVKKPILYGSQIIEKHLTRSDTIKDHQKSKNPMTRWHYPEPLYWNQKVILKLGEKKPKK